MVRHKVLFVQPVLSPYTIPRYAALAQSDQWEVHTALETKEFPTRPGWVPQPIPGVQLHVLSNWLLKKRVADGSRIDKALPYGLISEIRRIKPHIVIVCNPTEYVLALVARMLWGGFRLGLLMEDTLHSQRHKQGITAWLRKRLYRQCDFIVCYSHDAEEYIKSLGTEAARYRTSWSIDSEWLSRNATSDQNVSKTKGQVANSTVSFLFVGALIERKGLQPFLEAWCEAMKGREDVELVVLGSGPLAETLEQYCLDMGLDNVKLVGAVSYQEVGEYYRSADVFVLPTMEDLFSLVVTEAMAYGLPVLTSIYNGARELVEEGVNGYVFDSTSITEMAEVISRVCNEADRLPEMGQRSREIISDYTHEKVMERFGQVLTSEANKLPVGSAR